MKYSKFNISSYYCFEITYTVNNDENEITEYINARDLTRAVILLATFHNVSPDKICLLRAITWAAQKN